MNGELAQLIALVTHGNTYLRTGEIQADFYPANTAFQFCNSLFFYQHKKTTASNEPVATLAAADPVRWMDLQQQASCSRFKLVYMDSPANALAPNYMMAGFVGGGGTWLIESVYAEFSRFTNKAWDVTDQHHPERKIWSVRYDEHPDTFESTRDAHDIATLSLQLDGTLTDIAAFARSEHLEFWADKFDKARSTLHQLEPGKDFYHLDLIPPGEHSLEVRRLLFGAAESWVFGGMGWWNDNSFRDHAMYKRLTGDLYGLFNRSVMAAVNAM